MQIKISIAIKIIFKIEARMLPVVKKPSKKQPDYHRLNGANSITEVCF